MINARREDVGSAADFAPSAAALSFKLAEEFVKSTKSVDTAMWQPLNSKPVLTALPSLTWLVQTRVYVIIAVTVIAFISVAVVIWEENVVVCVLSVAVALTFLFAELTRTNLHALTLLAQRFEWWFLVFNILEHVIFGAWSELASTNVHGYAAVATVFRYVLFAVGAVFVISLDASVVPQLAKTIFLAIFVGNTAQLLYFGWFDVQDASQPVVNVCLWQCTDARRLSLAGLAAAGLFAGKYLGISLYGLLTGKQRFVLLQLTVHSHADFGDAISFHMYSPANDLLRHEVAIDRAFHSVSCCQSTRGLSRSRIFQAFVAIVCIIEVVVVAFRYAYTDEGVWFNYFIAAGFLFIFNVEAARFDRTALKQLLSSFESWFVLGNFLAYFVFVGLGEPPMTASGVVASVVHNGIYLVAGTFACLFDAAVYPVKFKQCLLFILLANSMRLLVALRLHLDPYIAHPVCFTFCTDAREAMASCLTAISLFFTKYLITTLIGKGDQCIIFKVPVEIRHDQPNTVNFVKDTMSDHESVETDVISVTSSTDFVALVDNEPQYRYLS